MSNTEQTKQMNKGRVIEGKVVSVKGTQTAIVEVSQTYRHPLYKKTVRLTKHIAAHNLLSGIVVGDRVKMLEVPPVSKTKHFQLIEKVTV